MRPFNLKPHGLRPIVVLFLSFALQAKYCGERGKKNHKEEAPLKIEVAEPGVLHKAVDEGKLNTVKIILKGINDFKEENKKVFLNSILNGTTPLGKTIKNQNKQMIQLLLQQADIDYNKTGQDLFELFYIAASEDWLAVVQKLRALNIDINARDKKNSDWTPLMHAVAGKSVQVVKYLIEQKADINLQDTQGDAALHLATRRGYENVVKLLLEARGSVNVNLQNDKRDAALHIAAYNGFKNIVTMLLKEQDMDVNIKGEAGDTALSQAASNGHAAVVKLLLQVQNIDVNLQNNAGNTALHLAIDRKHVDVVKRLVQEEKLNLNIKNDQNRTFLYLANESNNVEIINAIRGAIKNIDKQVMKDLKDNHFSTERIKYWVDKGLLNIDARDGEGDKSTLLMHIAKNNDASAVKFLIDQGASVNEQDKDGDTALHLAARRNNISAVKELLKSDDIKVNMGNYNGATVLKIDPSHTGMIALLKKAGAV